jgi:FAD/FMN-containing dehydrogenase
MTVPGSLDHIAGHPRSVFMAQLDQSAVAAAFKAGFSGDVVTPNDVGYDERRAVWNGAIDRRPALIAVCSSVDHVVEAVSVSRALGVSPAVRGGGHSVAGLSASDGVVIDLSDMGDVVVDRDRRVATAQPGATWADYDRATAGVGLASTGGLISTTGVAGLTLGGGIGWLMRKHGLACDNLRAADVVTAEGTVVTTSDGENADLMWALRGGGGNFGVVVRFEFDLHPIDTVLGGLMLFPLDRGRQALESFGAWSETASDDGSLLAAVITAPPEPFVPADLVGQKVVAVVGCWSGDLDEGATALQPLRELEPSVDLFGPMPYPVLQAMLDAGAPKGARNYFRAGYVDRLGDDFVDAFLEHGAQMPSPMSQLHVHQLGGAVGRVDRDATAFSARDAAFAYNVVSTWFDAADDDIHLNANRAAAAALAPTAVGGSYVNFLADQRDEQVRAAYGASTYARLVAAKRRWDPDNFFRHNQNIAP